MPRVWRASALGTPGHHRWGIGTIYGRKLRLLIPVGLEKEIPGDIVEASEMVAAEDEALTPILSLWPVYGDIFTEIEAFLALTGATATPVAAGGIAGAEGALRLLLTGGPKQVQEAGWQSPRASRSSSSNKGWRHAPGVLCPRWAPDLPACDPRPDAARSARAWPICATSCSICAPIRFAFTGCTRPWCLCPYQLMRLPLRPVATRPCPGGRRSPSGCRGRCD